MTEFENAVCSLRISLSLHKGEIRESSVLCGWYKQFLVYVLKNIVCHFEFRFRSGYALVIGMRNLEGRKRLLPRLSSDSK